MHEDNELDLIRNQVIDSIAKNMNLYGVTESIGRLYGLLYFSEHPMTLDEMKDELRMSKTSMSTSVRSLLELKMVEKVWKKGVRKGLYKAEEDWYQTFTDFFTIKWRAGISINVNAIKKSLQDLEELKKKPSLDPMIESTIEADIKKLEDTLQYYDWLNRLVDKFETKEIFDFVPKENKSE